MIIDKEQLISLLKEKTGHEREKVEDQLTELIKRIQKAAEEGKSFEIEGFGTFSMEDDDLRFEPSDTLETEINNKYAGMKPIELIGAFKEPEGNEVPEIDEGTGDKKDKVWAFDKEAEEEIVPEESADEEFVEQPEKQEEPATAEGDMESPFEMLDNEEGQTTTSSRSGEDTAATDEEPVKTLAEGEEESDTIGKLLVAVVIVIAVGLSGWVVYDTGLLSDSSSTAESGRQTAQLSAQQNTESQEESSPSQESTSQDTEENNTSEPEQELSVGKQEDPQSKEQSEEETTFGLKGEVNESISNGYTIVVHSLRSMELAENRREELQEAGYRALISKAEVQGAMYFRVGLGQFPTVDAAQQAVSDIPETYRINQNYFIKRIQ